MDESLHPGDGWHLFVARYSGRFAFTRHTRYRSAVYERALTACREGQGGIMQPFWSLSFPSLDALEECERRRTSVQPLSPSSKTESKKTRSPRSKQMSPIVAVPEMAAGAYAELIAEHFARAVYIA